MVAVLRAVVLGLLLLAVTLHVVGYVTHYWISAELDKRGLEDIMGPNGMGAPLSNQIGLSVNMGLWKYCMRSNLGQFLSGMGAAMSGQGDGPGDNLDQGGPGDSGAEEGDSWSPQGDAGMGDLGAGLTMDMCQKPNAADVPGWMKGVQALGILSMIAAVLGIAAIIYGFIGDSKGDRARLLPHITAAICLLAGVLQLIAVAVYGGEYLKMMDEQMGAMPPALAQNIRQHTHLGYSFALEAVSGVMMVLAAVLAFLPAIRGSQGFAGGSRNFAV